MTTKKQNWFKRSLSLLTAAMLLVGMGATHQVSAADEGQTVSERYTVPIQSLTSAAPLPAVQTAFAGAFGESVTVTVNEDGTKTALIKNHHMVIDLMGNKYDANVASIIDANTSIDGNQSAVILSTKQEVYTKGMTEATQEAITVPDEFTIPLSLDENNAQKIKITVDFMDAFLGGGNPYPTEVTLTLDVDAAKIDTSVLEALVNECKGISAENYTQDSLDALNAAITKAEGVVSNPETTEKLNAMIEELGSVKNGLVYKGADYGAVTAAIAKIPADRSIYTDESWTVVEAAKKAVVNGLDVSKQDIVNGYASDIEAAVSGLQLKEADYSQVDRALASVPSDMSAYTDDTVGTVNHAVAAVQRGLKADRQKDVDAMAAAVAKAVAGLQKKETGSSAKENNNPADEKLDIHNLKDGTYEISVDLWHASQDKASMAASSFNGTARIVVKNGNKTVYVYTQPMTFGSITASLQEMRVEQANGSWVTAEIEQKSNDGNPVCFSFPLDDLRQYVNAKVNPHVEMMGNQDLDARLKFNLGSIKRISEASDEKPLTPPAGTSRNPETGDNTAFALWMTMLLVFVGAFAGLTFYKKSRGDFGRQ